MGILRSDRVSGLGGANAINGSVFFGTSNNSAVCRGLIVSNTSELDIGTGNFTIEYWFNTSQTSATGYAGVGVATWEYTNSSSNTALNIYHFYKGIRIFNRISGGFTKILDNTDNWSTDTWHHFAWVREGTGSSENKVYIDGTLIGSAFTNAADYTTGQDWLIGANNYSGFPEYGFSGHLSNVRVSNVARYTANFTTPTTRFEKDANTIILACQSPGNVLQEATGKIITAGSTQGSDYGLPVASHFAPDKGEDHGTTFADNTKFDTLSYMVPPGGTTTQSNRGRGLIAGGCTPTVSTIEYIQIQSQGTSITFGDLSAARFGLAGCASATRGLFGGGAEPTVRNYIEYVTIATTSNIIDFGDLTVARRDFGGLSSQTRGIFAGGHSSPTLKDEIDYVTIATTGDATDFGNLTTATKETSGSCSSPTRGVIAGGGTPSAVNTIQYITIATTGHATDFGDLTRTAGSLSAAASATRAVFANGGTNTIDYITIATTGDATDFGDTTAVRGQAGGVSNSIRGVFTGGYQPSPTSSDTNILDFIDIATTGNAQDFGDINRAANDSNREHGTCSDSHGGLS